MEEKLKIEITGEQASLIFAGVQLYVQKLNGIAAEIAQIISPPVKKEESTEKGAE